MAYRTLREYEKNTVFPLSCDLRDEVDVNPYDPDSPYLYQFTPVYAEYPYGIDYHEEFIPSYPSWDSSTRIIYRT